MHRLMQLTAVHQKRAPSTKCKTYMFLAVQLYTPRMVQFNTLSERSLGKALDLPHSSGKVPDNKLFIATPEPISKLVRDGSAVSSPQEAGRVPVKLVMCNTRTAKAGQVPGLPHVVGILPVVHKQTSSLSRCLICVMNLSTKIVIHPDSGDATHVWGRLVLCLGIPGCTVSLCQVNK